MDSVKKEVSTFYTSTSLAIITCTLCIILYFWKNWHFYKMAARIPNYKSVDRTYFGLSFLGQPIEECFRQTMELFRKSPELFKYWLGPTLIIGATKPEHMEILLNNAGSMNKSPFVEYTNPYTGEGLFTARMNVWRRHRKLLNPTFNQKILNSFVSVFSERCELIIEELESLIGQPNIDIMDVFTRSTLDVICETIMGIKTDHSKSSIRYSELLDRYMEIITQRIFNVFYHPDIIFNATKIGKESFKVVAELNGHTQKVIEKRREIFEQKLRGEYIDEANKMKSFLDRMLEISYNGNQFTNKEIQDEVNTFIAAGSDTSASSMSFCCLTLGLFPEHQQKVYEEAMEVLGPDRYPTENDLPKLKYLEMFIKETLRLFPIAPLIFRMTTDDVKLDEFVLPKGCIIVMGVMHMHRNPKYWKDPLKFDPNRFLPEEWSKKHPYSYLAFSAGPRNCIGSRYAMMLMKVILSKIVRKFKITTDYKSIEEVDIKINIMSRPAHGFKTHFELRD